jgi:hypothetical protein
MAVIQGLREKRQEYTLHQNKAFSWWQQFQQQKECDLALMLI